jgi:hypothetical protein
LRGYCHISLKHIVPSCIEEVGGRVRLVGSEIMAIGVDSRKRRPWFTSR